MNIMLLIIILLIISFIMAFISLKDYKGEKEYHRIGQKLGKERIKGGIVFDKKDRPQHYKAF